MFTASAASQKRSKAPRVEDLGPPLKEAANGWTNYACPFCADGKPNHFWLSPEGSLGMCHKCGWRGRVRNVAHQPAVPLPTLVSRALLALGRGVVAPSVAVSGREGLRGWEPVSWEEASRGTGWGLICNYAQAHHISTGALASCGVRVLRRLASGVALYFPSSMFISGVSPTTAQIRLLGGGNHEPRWQTVPALPLLERAEGVLNNGDEARREPPPRERDGGTLVLTESPVDALRLRGVGFLAVALQGTLLTEKVLHLLREGLFRALVLLLDSDALEKAVRMQATLKAAFPSTAVDVVYIPHDPASGKVRDPCDLSDDELDALLLPFLQPAGGAPI